MSALRFLLFWILTWSGFCFAQKTDLFLRFPIFDVTSTLEGKGISEILTQDLTGYEIFQAKITPIFPQASLSLTVFFEEKELKTIRILWLLPSGESQMLCANLAEGTLLQNQRTVLIPAALLSTEGGTLLIQSDQITLDIQAIHFQWSSLIPLLSPLPSTGPHLLTPQGLLRYEEISGQLIEEKIDSAQSTIATTVLVSRPESIDHVAYGFELSQIPSRIRIELELQGLPVDETLRIYVNGIDLGSLPIELPSLNSPGYLTANNQYWGWRKSTLWIPQGSLRTGTNTLQLSTSTHRTISIKNLLLETDFKSEVQP